MDLLQRIKSGEARVGIIGLGYVGLPLAVEFAKAGLHVVGYDVDQSKIDSLTAGKSYIPDVPSEELAAGRQSRDLPRDDRSARARGCRHHRHLRADAASKDARPGSVLCRQGDRSDRGRAAQGTARHSRVDDLPGHDRRGRAARARGGRAESRPRLLSGVLARARRSGQPDVHDEEHPEGRRRDRSDEHRSRRGALRTVVDKVVKVAQHARRRDGEAAREHVPRRQHRAGQRDCADVPPPGHRRVGSDRRRRHEAVRLHAVLSGSRAWAATASLSIRSICRGRRGRAASSAASSSWPATSTARCPSSSSSG